MTIKESSYINNSYKPNNSVSLTALLLKKVENTLLCLGILPNLLGYNLIRDAVVLKLSITQKVNIGKIYDALSKHYKTNVSCIERNIRNAITFAFNNKTLVKINEMLGAEVIKGNYSLTNSQLISLLAKYLDETNCPGLVDDLFCYFT